MKKLRRLKDEYRYPGFVPLPAVKGVFGDPMALVITLRRGRKKRAAVAVVSPVERSMTNVHERFAICPVVTSEFISRSICVAFNAPSVVL